MSNLIRIHDILEELSSTTKSTEKKIILKKYEDDLLWLKVVDYTLDAFKTYGIKKTPDHSTDGDSSNFLNDALFASLDSLRDRELTGHAAIDRVSTLLSEADSKSREVIKRIIQKDLKCGVAASTINSVYGKGTVFKYPCMLASKQDEKTMAGISYPAFVQTKFDGLRANVVKDGDDTYVYTRSGKELTVSQKFSGLPSGHYVVDGELLVVKEDESDYMTRKESNGILNKAQKGTISESEVERVRMVAWDWIPLSEFKEGYSDLSYKSRLEGLGKVALDSDCLLVAKNYLVWGEEESLALFKQNLSEGQEGIIIKNTECPWEDKRSKNMVKMKEVNTADLRIIEVLEGEGKYTDKLGALLLEDDNKTVRVKVGTGFSDEQREALWNIGDIVEVQYNERISSKNKELDSLFLPVFMQIRKDKDTTNVD